MMNKEIYNYNLKRYINDLIKIKDECVNEITEIATYIEVHNAKKDNCNLTRYDIEMINEKRQYIVAIYELIGDLDKLIKKD